MIKSISNNYNNSIAIAIAINGKKLLESRKEEIKNTPTPEVKTASISLIVPKSGIVKQKETIFSICGF